VGAVKGGMPHDEEGKGERVEEGKGKGKGRRRREVRGSRNGSMRRCPRSGQSLPHWSLKVTSLQTISRECFPEPYTTNPKP
jgi:hypothetical protein